VALLLIEKQTLACHTGCTWPLAEQSDAVREAGKGRVM